MRALSTAGNRASGGVGKRTGKPGAACYGTAMRRFAALVMLTLSLAACAADQDGFPSLERRPAERVSGTAVPIAAATEEVPVPPTPEVSGRLGSIENAALNADAKFKARTPETRRLVNAGAGAAVASEGWSVATAALAALEGARSEAMIALADLDAMYAAERVAGGDGAAIAASRDRVLLLIGEEDAVLIALRERMRS